jgi:hypothetical protein
MTSHTNASLSLPSLPFSLLTLPCIAGGVRQRAIVSGTNVDQPFPLTHQPLPRCNHHDGSSGCIAPCGGCTQPQPRWRLPWTSINRGAAGARGAEGRRPAEQDHHHKGSSVRGPSGKREGSPRSAATPDHSACCATTASSPSASQRLHVVFEQSAHKLRDPGAHSRLH